MDSKELLKKVRQIEIKSRRLSDNLFGGEYLSTFKGRGMTFSEVRKYEFGDDIRAIDWNVTARYNEPFIKIFEEERELTLMLLIDVSGSENFATRNKLKKEIITEIAATLSFSALKNNDKVISLSVLSQNLISSNKDEMKSKEEFILTITENGYGKRSSSYDYRETGRGGQGIINISTSERNGNVAASFPINSEDDIMLVTNKGQMIRVKVSEIRVAGRNTQGVRIFKTDSNEKVVTAVRLTDENE